MDARDRSPNRRGQRAAKDGLHAAIHHAGQECRTIADRLGFRYFHFGVHAILRPGAPIQVFVDGAPDGLVEIFELLAVHGEDAPPPPGNALTPFDWRKAMTGAGKAGELLLQRGNQAGMCHGVAVPIHGPGGAHGLLVLGDESPLPQSEHVKSVLYRDAHWAAVQMFERLLASIQDAWIASPRRALTVRQRRALTLLAGGHALVGIARKMRVHSSTARYLVVRAMEKLGVQTREEALVRFAAAGELHHRLYPRSIRDTPFRLPVPHRS